MYDMMYTFSTQGVKYSSCRFWNASEKPMPYRQRPAGGDVEVVNYQGEQTQSLVILDTSVVLLVIGDIIV